MIVLLFNAILHDSTSRDTSVFDIMSLTDVNFPYLVNSTLIKLFDVLIVLNIQIKKTYKHSISIHMYICIHRYRKLVTLFIIGLNIQRFHVNN